jgi:hypothetical protein
MNEFGYVLIWLLFILVVQFKAITPTLKHVLKQTHQRSWLIQNNKRQLHQNLNQQIKANILLIVKVF